MTDRILIADSGATRTKWCMPGRGEIPQQFSTGGINPFFCNTEDILAEWKLSLLIQLSQKTNKVFFYGAGIVNDEKKQVIRLALSSLFPAAETEVESDLLAAARATLGNTSGIACILGTGSNSCQYNGKMITAHIPPLGFILGDEGSGAAMGRQLLGDFLKKIMPHQLSHQFQQKYPVKYDALLNSVYHGEKPSQFLAGFVPFLKENIKDEYCKELVENAFDSFIIRNVSQYHGHKQQPVCFAGSVAFYFREQLMNILFKRNLIPGIILKEPLLKLMEYHLQFSKK